MFPNFFRVSISMTKFGTLIVCARFRPANVRSRLPKTSGWGRGGGRRVRRKPYHAYHPYCRLVASNDSKDGKDV